jgi:hypothetical protein
MHDTALPEARRMVRYQDIADEMSVRTSLTHFEGACLGESYAP